MTGRGDDPSSDGVSPDRLRGTEAVRRADLEYWRFGAVLGELRPADWDRPTDCTGWTVHDLVAHVVGVTEANASVAEMLRQLAQGRRGLAVEVDRVSAAQVRSRCRLTPRELIERFRTAAPVASRRRALWARAAGRVPLRVGEPVHETWPLRYLMESIYTRDVWMHRVDVSRAVGRDLILTAEHDGRIVADVVADWMDRHGTTVQLTLTGPAGGSFTRGRGGQTLDLDAVEFCRVLSGRAVGPGLLAVAVPF